MGEADPRAQFAERFALLYALAGSPPLKQLAVDRRDPRGARVQVSVQRVSAWRKGENVPARFDGLAIVLQRLADQARPRHPTPPVAGLYDLRVWRSWWQAASTQPAGTGDDEDRHSPAPPEDAVCPYQGLSAFSTEDAAWFYGRTEAIDALAHHVCRAVADGGLVMLVGASGAGKSSLLRAGLLPLLAGEGLPGTDCRDWPVLVCAPGDDPVRALDVVPGLADVVADALEGDESAEVPAQAVRDVVEKYAHSRGGSGTRAVILVDQLEELFTLCADHRRRRVFLDVLTAAAAPSDTGRPAPSVVVLAVRADFYSYCLTHPALAEALQQRQMLLRPMTVTEMREAINRPAKEVGLVLEPGLVELVLHEAGVSAERTTRADSAAAGILPLLSHALQATWQRRQAGRLTVSGYRRSGGITGAIEATAERAWSELDSTGQAAALRVLMALTRVSNDGHDTRRRATKTRLLTQNRDREATERALETFTRARLISSDVQDVQITHEALLRAWPRLRRWIDRDREALLHAQTLEEDAARWAEQERDAGLLYRAARLDTTRRMLAGREDLTVLADQFLTASTQAWRRRLWGRRAGIGLVMVLTPVAIIAAITATAQRDHARFLEVLAQAQQQQTSDPALSAQLNLVAHRMRPDDPQAIGRVLATQQSALARALPAGNGAIFDASFSPDGKTLATSSDGHLVQLWDLADRWPPTPLGAPLVAGTSWASSARFSPDGRVLASSDGDGTLRLWDITNRASPRLLTSTGSGDGAISLLTFSPGGTMLATANDNGSVQLWNVTDPRRPVAGARLTGHTGVVRSVAFSPDGHLLAAGGDDKTTLLWNVTDPAVPVAQPTPLVGHTDAVHSVAFSPSGTTLATGSDDKTARLWNVTDPARPTLVGTPLVGHVGAIWSVAFSPDGTRLVTASQDGSSKLWDVTDPTVTQATVLDLPSNTGGMFSSTFSPDGRTIAAGGRNGTTLLWSLPRTELIHSTAPINSLAVSPDGRLLASAGTDAMIRLWNLTDPGEPSPLADFRLPNPAGAVAIAHNGRTLATSTTAGTTTLFDITDPAHPVPIGAPVVGHAQYARALDFSPDDTMAASPADDTHVQLWSFAPPGHLTPLAVLQAGAGFISSLAFSPDGRTMAVATSAGYGQVSLWDLTDRARPVLAAPRLDPHRGGLRDVTFSHDGRTLFVGDEGGNVLRWDVHDATRPRALTSLSDQGGSLYALAANTDLTRLASAGADRPIQLWNLSDADRPVAVPMSTTTATVKALAMTTDSRWLFSAGDDNSVQHWNLELDPVIARLCHDTAGTLTETTWKRLVPDLSYDPPCS
ncbi:MAG TPA: AAA family ATPase [Pseudonocardia sp.]|nr:AAA family ATPase [Pseudonocardia sp.]